MRAGPAGGRGCGVPQQRAAARARLRAWRRGRDAATAAAAAHAVARRAARLRALVRARHVAVYLAGDGELDTAPLIRALWRAGKAVYLPVTVDRTRPLVFRRYTAATPLAADALGMPAPVRGAARRARDMDLVFVPLLGFDAHGRRLGRGGGHYDRSLRAAAGRAPPRVGLAYDGQRLAHVSPARWDVPLDAVITPRAIWQAGRAFGVIPPML